MVRRSSVQKNNHASYIPDTHKLDSRSDQELLDHNLADDWRAYLQKRRTRTTVRTMFDIDRSLKTKLEKHAKQQDIPMSQLIRQALEQFIQ